MNEFTRDLKSPLLSSRKIKRSHFLKILKTKSLHQIVRSAISFTLRNSPKKTIDVKVLFHRCEIKGIVLLNYTDPLPDFLSFLSNITAEYIDVSICSSNQSGQYFDYGG